MLEFRDIKNGKNKFYHHKSPVPQKDVNIEKVFVSKKTINTSLASCRMIIKLGNYI